MTAPTEKDYEKRRGVMAWSFDLEAQGENVIKTGYRITWPENMKIGQAE
jgi:predicted secreted protein